MIDLLLIAATRFVVGGQAVWPEGEDEPDARQRIVFANHASHLDALLVWSALPRALRPVTHPVAAADYWGADPLRRFVAGRGLNALLIRRDDPRQALEALGRVMKGGRSIVIFPEGTRGNDRLPAPFKPGLHRLALDFPEAELRPAYLDNPGRALPKGRLLPIPFACAVRFGPPLPRVPGEARPAFLQRAREAVVALAPPLPA